ncbi:hypothetical protein [Schlesneria sp. T3-172]|uniref:hypothetical protein n=1 Tax=Schlesneria sphaerica TaxID=3373610 RepID=UPI0037CC1425
MVLVPRKASSFNTILSKVILIEFNHFVPDELARRPTRDCAIRTCPPFSSRETDEQTRFELNGLILRRVSWPEMEWLLHLSIHFEQGDMANVGMSRQCE